ncbi:MAG: C39 family peptidase, partial [Gammaproteobacteria bacterium]
MMKSRFLPFVLLLLPYCANGEQQAITNDILFKGVTKQSTDYSCGAAALSTLITGLVENARISEKDVIDEIAKLSDNRDSQGYTLSDLMEVSKNLEHYAEWRKVPVSQLPKIKIPVILLIGLNSKFPHFVVLKGIVDDQAFLADSIRGNIRIPYKKLTEEGVTEKYKDWFVMAIEPSANIPKDSNLYLAEDKFSSHFTVEQSSAITLST